MTDTQLVAAPPAGPIKSAVLDMARSVLLGVGTPLLAHGLVTGSQWQDIVGGLVAVASLLWSYLAAHQSHVNLLAMVQAWVRAGDSQGAWNGDVQQLAIALVPAVEKIVDAQIHARAGILAGPIDAVANTAIKEAAAQGATAVSVPLPSPQEHL